MSLIQNVFWTISSTQHILLSVCMLIKCVCSIFISLISIELIIIKRSDSFTISKNWIGEMLIWRLIMNRRIGWLQLFYIIHSNGLCHSFHEHNHKKSELEDGIVILSIVVQDNLKNMIHSSIRFLSDVGLITEERVSICVIFDSITNTLMEISCTSLIILTNSLTITIQTDRSDQDVGWRRTGCLNYTIYFDTNWSGANKVSNNCE